MDLFILEAIFFGALISFIICFTGVGGGVLVIPTVTFFFDVPISAAIGTASAYAALTKILAGVEHIRIKNVSYPLITNILITAIPSALIFATLINYLISSQPEHEEIIQETLRIAVLIAIFTALLSSIFQSKLISRPTSNLVKTLIAGTVFGAMIGTTGIGGGVLVPLLMLVSPEQPKRIVGSAIIIALILSLVVALIYAGGQQIEYRLTLWMALGSCIGIPIGSRLIRLVSEKFVHTSVIILIALSFIMMLMK